MARGYSNPQQTSPVSTAPVPVAEGGTGSSTASGARTNLGLGTAATKDTGTTNGTIPILGAGDVLATSVLPALSITSVFVVANLAARLALSTAQEGDVAIQTDTNKTYILSNNDPSVDANWKEIIAAPPPVLTGDSGAGGTAGLAPAPAAGDAAARKFLMADATWKTALGTANLVHAGTWTPYATLALAKAAAVSGDTVVVGPGTYNENDLAKAGVNWHFLPGASVTYTGASTTAIFDDGGAAMTFTITGDGKFTNSSSGGGGRCISLTHASSDLSIEALLVRSTVDAALFAANGAYIHGTVDTVDSSASGAYTVYGRVTLNGRTITSSGGGGATCVFSGGQGNIDITVDTISATNDSNGVYDGASVTTHVRAGSITATVGGSAVVIGNAGSLTYIEADYLSAVAGNTLAFNTTGTAYVIAKNVTNGDAGSWALASFGSGTYHVFGGRFQNTAVGGVAATIGGGTLVLHDDVSLVSEATATESLSSTGAKNVTVLGALHMNKAKGADVTILSGDWTESDPAVV